MSISKIVITGGPRNEKSGALAKVNKCFSRMGYTVIEVPEPDVSAEDIDSATEFIKEQLENERIAGAEALMLANEKILIICHSGTMDCKAKLAENEFLQILSEIGSNRVGLRDEYDGVFILGEDEGLMGAWVGHTHLRICTPGSLEEEIAFFLGEPKPLEIERKFLIEYPDINALESNPLCRKISISQTYLKDEEGNFRVRERGEADGSIYFMTRKKQISPVVRIEVENNISKEEYERYVAEATEPKLQVTKNRYCLIYQGQYFEIDVFPFWDDRALVEIELKSEDEEISLPPEFKVIREVTTEEEYKNSRIAKMLAKQNELS